MLLPSDVAKESEASQQTAFFIYCRFAEMWGFAIADKVCSGEYTISKDGGITVPLNATSQPIPHLKWIHHIPNGGARGDDAKSRAIRGGQLKAQGVKDGILDVFWPRPVGGYAGLYIEFKKPDKKPKRGGSGGVSPEQREFLDYATEIGYWCAVAYTWEEAAQYLKQYCGYHG